MFSNAYIMFASVVGVDLNVYNESDDFNHHPQQPYLDELILDVNRYITTYNVYYSMPTPFIATPFHKYVGGGRVIHRYDYLSDGCHFDCDAMVPLAFKLDKAVFKLHRWSFCIQFLMMVVSL